jgi:hypothetical protein
MKLPNFLKRNIKVEIGSLRKSIEIDPFLYWKKILFLMLIVLIIVAVSSFFIYYMVNSGKFINEATRLQVQALVVTELKTKELDKTTNMFLDRENVRLYIIQDETIIPDPSINPGAPVVEEEIIKPIKTSR